VLRRTLVRCDILTMPGRSFEEARLMTMSSETAAEGHGDASVTKRDFLFLMTGSLAAVGVAATAWPFIDQMNPDAATIAAAGPVDIDIQQLQPGQRVVALWAARPVFVVKRADAALEELKNPNSQEPQQPAYAANWSRSIKPEILVIVGVCTHLGCIPLFDPQPNATDPAPDWPGGFFCPCHGSKYDLAGRVFQGVPAPYNLPVPPYHFPDDKTVRVGENPPGQNFDFNSILQV
jgi:ubiquinol-cytochrome c reductase iron-sulfur subunit